MCRKQTRIRSFRDVLSVWWLVYLFLFLAYDNNAAEEVAVNWNEVGRVLYCTYEDIDTSELNKDEISELNGCSITPADLEKYPDAVKDVAHFSINLRLQSRKTVDAFINEGRI